MGKLVDTIQERTKVELMGADVSRAYESTSSSGALGLGQRPMCIGQHPRSTQGGFDAVFVMVKSAVVKGDLLAWRSGGDNAFEAAKAGGVDTQRGWCIGVAMAASLPGVSASKPSYLFAQTVGEVELVASAAVAAGDTLAVDTDTEKAAGMVLESAASITRKIGATAITAAAAGAKTSVFLSNSHIGEAGKPRSA